MDKFPQELVDRISGYLPRDDLKHTLTVSSKFRFAAERCSGAFTKFCLEEGNAKAFLDTYANHRLLYLRHVEFRTKFSRLEYTRDPKIPCRENADELREKDETFTRQIKFLFTTVKTVEERAGEENFPGRVQLTIYTPTRLIDSGICLHRRFTSWRVHLLAPESLPELASIRSLEIQQGVEYSRFNKYDLAPSKLDLRVLVDLITRLPNLEYCGCQMGGDEWAPHFEEEAARHFVHDWEGPRRDSRHDFAKAIRSTNLPDSLRRARLDFLNPLEEAENIDHRQRMPDLVSPAPQDPFSSSLRLLSYHLRQLQLRVMADETLFWPGSEVTLSWPNLESLDVMFHMVSPSGSWYFEGPKGEGHDTAGFKITNSSYPPLEETSDDKDMDYELAESGDRRSTTDNSHFRVAPNDTTLGLFIAGFAKAAAEMPSLREAAIWSPLRWYPGEDLEEEYDLHPQNIRTSLAWGIAYIAPGGLALNTNPGENYSQARQIWWKVAKWRPDPQLHDLFHQIGRQKHGEDLKEYWNDDEYGEELIDRYVFEGFIFGDGEPGRIPTII
ncbi:hypothetical protein K469DRAFT_672349 [Zopfia rhizophila CBS 207.26]|uniref:F-box domain-containing protein n=1 Tax=Zopfia rhizophila CBS 207.26 TaxID=1314779 RepID=A0A6A6DNA5_9PEZI|nr:hypothetical protein K469DRAFT_672349 [Zopfia rhizophila CBS 207.26]